MGLHITGLESCACSEYSNDQWMFLCLNKACYRTQMLIDQLIQNVLANEQLGDGGWVLALIRKVNMIAGL